MSKSFSFGLDNVGLEAEDAAAFAEMEPTPIADRARELLRRRDFWDITTAVGLVFGIQPRPRIWAWAEKVRPDERPPLAQRVLALRATLEATNIPHDEQGRFEREAFLKWVADDFESGNIFGYDEANLGKLGIKSSDSEQEPKEQSKQIDNLRRALTCITLLYLDATQQSEGVPITKISGELARKIKELRGPRKDGKNQTGIGEKTISKNLTLGRKLLEAEWEGEPEWKVDGKPVSFRPAPE